ncbi:DUF6412 domain-containing protein [Herbiconiux sp. A18JL235]|uniref:DUF6412 domain-containing protein n=1 Tax=Herbiconiux sp. A18JL235 TaxID=3152363 RepID=A0AB39BKC5_9MICO
MDHLRRDAHWLERDSAGAGVGVSARGLWSAFDQSPFLRRLSVLLGLLSVGSASAMIFSALGAVGAAGSAGTGTGTDGVLTALALAAVVTTACAVAALAVVLLAASTRHRHTRRCEAADDDLPTVITQSRPDAPGRPRTRAPGRLLAIA